MRMGLPPERIKLLLRLDPNVSPPMGAIQARYGLNAHDVGMMRWDFEDQPAEFMHDLEQYEVDKMAEELLAKEGQNPLEDTGEFDGVES